MYPDFENAPPPPPALEGPSQGHSGPDALVLVGATTPAEAGAAATSPPSQVHRAPPHLLVPTLTPERAKGSGAQDVEEAGPTNSARTGPGEGSMGTQDVTNRSSLNSSTASRAELLEKPKGASAAGSSEASAGSGGKMLHLSGARCLVALWVLCSHSQFWYRPSHPSFNVFAPFVWRARVGVNFFVELSGFLTHYTNAKRDLSGSIGSLAQFYTRRFGRVVVNTWLTMAIAGFTMQYFGVPFGSPNLPGWKLVRCFFFVEGWMDPEHSPVQTCPNFPSWTISALMPSWLLYPIATRPFLVMLERWGVCWLVGFAILLYTVSFGHTYWKYMLGGTLTEADYKRSYYYPPSQLADFALGACAAALARRCPPIAGLGILGDLALSYVLLFTLLAPTREHRRTSDGVEVLFNHGFALALAFFLYCTSAPGSRAAKLLSHPALVSLGDYSFAVYLWQAPLHLFLIIATKHGLQLHPTQDTSELTNEVFMGFVLSVWLFAALYVEYFETHLQKMLKRGTEAWGGKTLTWFWKEDKGDRYLPFRNVT